MALFDADNVQVSGGYDRTKLRVGRYLVKLTDSKEVVGGYKGQRYQTVFEVVAGRHAPAGAIKSDIIMSQSDPQKAKKDNFKIQKRLAAFLNVKPAAITNELYAKITRTSKVSSTQTEGEVELKTTFPADKGLAFGKIALLNVKPYTNKAGKRTCFYDYEPFTGKVEDFETYVDEPYDDAEEGEADAAYAADPTAAPAVPAEDAPPAVPEEAVEDPMTKAANAGWKLHP